MNYSFLKIFPFVRYMIEGDGKIVIWIYKTYYGDFNSYMGDDITNYIQNTGLLEMLYPKAPAMLDRIEALFVAGDIHRSGRVIYHDQSFDNNYWFDENGVWQ